MSDSSDRRNVGAAACAVALLAVPSLLLPAAQGVVAEALQPDPGYGRVAQLVARHLPGKHLTRSRIDDDVSARAWTNYLDALDYERIYFVAADEQAFAAERVLLDDQIRAGDTAFAYRAYEILKERVRDRVVYVEQLLEKGFDFDVEETYRWRRREADRAKAREDWDDLWRRRIKNEYLRRVISRELAEEAEAEEPEQDPVEDPAADPAEDPTADVKADGEEETETGTEAEAETEAEQEIALTPEEFILKRYRQFLTLLEDNDAEWVLQKYLSAFAHAYDPHSEYWSPSSAEDFDIEMKLSLVGIGALLKSEDGTAKIVRVIPGGPAASDKREKRLRPGDKIIAVAQENGEPVDILHWPLPKIVRLIRGKKGTTVVLTVVPASDASETTTRKVDLVRDTVKLEESAARWARREVVDGSEVTHAVGVVTLPAFYASMKAGSVNDPSYRSSADDVADLLREAQGDGAEGIVLDLRGNGGGSLLEAIRMTGLFIETGPTVQVRERYRVRVWPDRDPRIVYSGPLVILVNRLSASASEILAGALQDYGRAVIVGDSKTHGKGTVQTLVDLDGEQRFGSLKVTTASYYRISGASTQLKGITPDIVIPSPFEYMEFGEDHLPNAIEWSQIAPVPFDPVTDLTPILPELRARSELRRGSDPRFEAYRQLLERVEKMNADAEVPLNIDRRREIARAEKELSELQESLAEQEAGEGDSEQTTDLVLEEALRILADIVIFEPPPPPSPPAPERNVADSIADWLKGKL